MADPILPHDDRRTKVACDGCAPTVAFGYWETVARHPPERRDRGQCWVCGEGEPVHTVQEWLDIRRGALLGLATVDA